MTKTTTTTTTTTTRTIATSTAQAWAIVSTMINDYTKDETSSDHAGYPIYCSASNPDNYICDLNVRLEVNINGKSQNIWIEAPAQVTVTPTTPDINTLTRKATAGTFKRNNTKQQFLAPLIANENEKIKTRKDKLKRNVTFTRKFIINEETKETEIKHIPRQLTNREKLDILLDINAIQETIEAYFDNIADYHDPIYQAASMITYHSLKTLSKGRKFTDKKGEIKYTPSNLIATKILQGENSSVNFDDLLQDVVLAIYEGIHSGTITIVQLDHISTKTGKAQTIHNIDGNEETRREIFNTVQNRLYSLQEKHSKHLYNVQYTLNDNGEYEETDSTMYTMAQRAFDLSIHNLEYADIINSLSIRLNDNEKAVLKACFETKQVERAYSDNGISKKHFVTRALTIEEKANFTGLSNKTVRNAIDDLKRKSREYLMTDNTSSIYTHEQVVTMMKLNTLINNQYISK